MKVSDIEEHEDGTATVHFDLENGEVGFLIEFALATLLSEHALSNARAKVMEETLDELVKIRERSGEYGNPEV